MLEENKALITDLFAAWNAHDVDGVAACIGDGCNGGGPEGIRRELTAFLLAFPDMTVSVEDMLAEGDRVATRTVIRGTHRGPLNGIAPTGRQATMKANHLFRCQAGKIIQRHGQMDRLELMMQLGMTLVPAGTGQAT